MNYKTALTIYNTIDNTKLIDLKDDLYKSAIYYANVRANWYLMSKEERAEADSSRTIAHNAFLDCVKILERNMKNNGENTDWRMLLGEDRKEIGDFACYLHLILGIMMR